MPIDMEQVKAALDPEEPDYAKAAKQLGADALPHLEKIIGGSDTSLAAKATYLAGLIGGVRSVPAVAKAARSTQAVVRIAAAAAAAHLPAQHSDAVLLQLVDDADHGVQKLAMRSAPAAMSDALRARVNTLRAAFAAAATPAAPQRAGQTMAAKKARTKKARPAKKAKRKKTR
jgi:HEAT repeat protein